MGKHSIKNIDYLNVIDGQNLSYGFSQEWYRDEYQVLAGCGATAAATILTYYNQCKEIRKLKTSDVLPLMEGLWTYLLPIKNKGLNSTKLFYDGIKKYSDEKKLNIKYEYLDVNIENKVDLDRIVNFLENELSQDRPVAFLNLCNGEEKELDRWHWVTIFEIFNEKEKYFLKIFDDKKIKVINFTLWYNTIKNNGGFVSFYY